MSSEVSGLELNWLPEQGRQALIEEALGLLATRMQVWDDLKSREQKLSSERHMLQPILDTIDLDRSAELHPAEAAYAALGAYILDGKLQETGRLLRSHDYEVLLQSIEFSGRKVQVTALDDRDLIGTSRINEYGQHQGLSKWYRSKRGKITRLNLHPANGGYIEFKGYGNKFYSATPLISRHNDYQPAFDIKLLD